MRLFIAFDISKEVEKKLRELQKEFDINGIKLAKELHMTLKFLGEVDKADEIKKKLKDIKFKSFKVNLDKLGVFPNEDYIKVVWVGLKPYDKILDLHNKIDNALESIFDKDKNFVPHLTLGRVKFVEDKEKLKEKLKLEIEGEFEIKEFKLYESVRCKGGYEYKCLETYSS